MSDSEFYSFKVKDIKGNEFNFADLKGKVVLVVNVASKCGFTPQYAGLQKLYDDYKDKNFTIIGFPCNQFGNQEPGTEQQIEQFCSLTYNVTFPIMQKVDVNGGHTAPVYNWLKSNKKQLLMERVKWNFEKFLVDSQGRVVERYASTTSPEALSGDIAKLLPTL